MKLEVISHVSSGSRAAPPLLFVHGSSHADWCWEEHFLAWFSAEGFSAHALSLRGHGGSEGAERLRWASVSDYVEDVRSVALRLPSPPVLVGHSLGGLVVQKYLEKYDAPGAVLLAPSPVRGMFRSGLRLFRQHPLLRHAARLGRESFRAMRDMTYRLPNVDRILSRRCFMLVVGAADDVVVPPAEVEDTARAYRAPGTIVPAIGHDMMLDESWECVARHVRQWLTTI